MRLSPVSVPYRAVQKVSGLLVLGFFAASSGQVNLAFVASAGLALLGLAFAYETAYFRRFEYELTEDTFDVHSGVVSRREREIPYGRIQNVDISRNVVQRLLGLAAVDLETAGGSSTEGAIRYVSAAEADRLQSEIQRRKAGAGSDRRAAESPDGETDADEASGTATAEPLESQELFAISATELALVGALSFDARLIGLLAFLGSGSVPIASQFLPPVSALAVTLTGVAFVVALAVGSWLLGVVVAVTNYYGFRLSRSGDELRYERGLFRRYNGSIPLEKVQTLSIEDNPLQRAFGYASLAIETAGYAPGQGGEYGSQAAVPLATRDRVRDLAREVESFGEPAFTRPPKRIRWRYAVRYCIALAVLTAVAFAVDWYLTVALPWYWLAALVALVPPAAHLKWVHRGYWLGEDHVVTRAGFWNRTTTVVPYYRIQTVIDTRTVFQRRWDVASVLIDTAGSRSIVGHGAAALDVESADAERLRDELTERLQRALAEHRSTRRRFSWVDVDSGPGVGMDASPVDANPSAPGDAGSAADSDTRPAGAHPRTTALDPDDSEDDSADEQRAGDEPADSAESAGGVDGESSGEDEADPDGTGDEPGSSRDPDR